MNARRTLKMRCLALAMTDNLRAAARCVIARERRDLLRAAREQCVMLAGSIGAELKAS